MEPLLKIRFSKRTISKILLAFLGLVLAIGTQVAIGTPPQAAQSICLSNADFTPEQLSTQGRTSYDQGRFDVAIDCWQRATAAYSSIGNETESINNRINLAQAEQALGLYPRACNTLITIYGQQDCTTLLKDENKRNNFLKTLELKINSPSKIIALHSFGNVLREIGELDLSHQILTLSLKLTPAQEQTALWLDVGNTRRALSNQAQDLYNRSQDLENIVCAIVSNYAAQDAYQKVLANTDANLNSSSLVKLQAQLNQFSLLLDLQDWRNQVDSQSEKNSDIVIRVFGPSIFSPAKESTQKILVRNCWNKLNSSIFTKTDSSPQSSTEEISNWVNERILGQNPLIQSQQINELQQQIEQLPPSHTTLYTRINFAQSLIRLPDLANSFGQIEEFLNATINQAKTIGNVRVQSYALGYLGKAYEKIEQWEQATTKTQLALLLAQSIQSPDMMYQWQWQLGRIYQVGYSVSTKANTKQIQSNLNEARSAYEGAFQTLESLRRELATGSPDIQLSFQRDIETIYREYVDVLLRKENPEPQELSKARTVISSLQSVELENFLRQACPEYNVQQIDQIIDQQATKTAFLYPIVLKDRVEVVMKLPVNTTDKRGDEAGIAHYRTMIPRSEVEKQVRRLQLDLEEDYTFESVERESLEVYRWLLKGSEKYLSKDIDTLVFALDTDLRNIPLAALVYEVKSDQPQYLVDKYAIALAPRLQIPTPTLLQGRKLNVLAAGLTESQVLEYQQEFPKLRFVKEELAGIQTVSPEKISLSQLIDQDFRFSQFRDKITTSAFQILHVATHGEFSSRPEKTFILASDRKIEVKDIDNLFRNQAQNQLEPIELVVLSACETAAGDKRATLGISGVGVKAGVRSAIASLWTLDDKISVDFTQKLYQQLVDPTITKAQALQKAQIALKSVPGREHPRYWAPYILLGNWL